MYLSLNWLKDFVDIPKKMTPEELALKMTLHTVEVDAVIKQADKYNNVVVGKILEIKPHPNADRLQLTKVDIGQEKLEIVCGANNIAVGQKVPVALVGAVLPNGIEIKEADVRGVKSTGMLCAEDELGLGEDHSGIIILDNKAKIGQNLADHLGLNDIIIEVDNKSITHRPDLWSHYGMARDIAASLNVKFKDLNIDRLDNEAMKTLSAISVKIEDFELCPRYMAVAIEGIKIAPSPQWMQDRLVAAGTRPISNIVDITNYVMLELGQPLHAFSMAQVSVNREQVAASISPSDISIIVRRARKEEAIETLDGEKRILDDNMLLITNPEGPLAVAGVMGGANSEIDDDTSAIVVESANFNFVSIRKTSQKLGLRTEASMRYEKSLDPNLCELALFRVIELVKQLCPEAKVISQVADEKKFQLNQGPIELDLKWLAARMGEKLKTGQVTKTLLNLGFGVEQIEGKLKVTIPTWRATKDISIPEDLLEEVSRIYGYDNLAPKMPSVAMKSPLVNEERKLERRIKNILVGAPSLSEVNNYAFVGEDQLKKLGINFSDYVRLANPITTHQTILRQTLAPNLINNIKTNQSRYDNIGVFEIGSIYLKVPGEINKDDKSDEKLPYQEKYLGIAMAGNKKNETFDRIKGVITYLFDSLNLDILFQATTAVPEWADEIYSADICIASPWSREAKCIGQVNRLANRAWGPAGIKKESYVAEISLGELFNIFQAVPLQKFAEFEKYPPVMRDLALVVDDKVLYNNIRAEIAAFSSMIRTVELFDVYRGEKIGMGKKNLAFHLVYQADKTLNSAEIDQIQNDLVKSLEEKFAARIRNY